MAISTYLSIISLSINKNAPVKRHSVILSKVSQIEEDKYHDVTCRRNLQKWYQYTYLQNRNSHMCIKQTCLWGVGKRGKG